MPREPIDLNARRAQAQAEPRVLLVDDDPALLQLMVRWLSGQGVRLFTSESGEAALEQLDSLNGIDVVVADYHMSGMHGIQLLNIVESRWPLARRILYTAYADSEMVLEAVRHKVLTKQMDALLVRDAILREARRR